MEADEVPMEGIRLCDMAALGEFTANGRRVFTKSGVGYFKIEKPVGNVPHDCSLSPPPAQYGGGVTAVLEPGAALDDGAREIHAAVWDNVVVVVGREAGRVGKVVEFIPGSSGDGIDDIYIVESILEGKFDARLLDLPTLGWEASRWPENFLAAKAADKVWQVDNGKEEYEWNILHKRAVRLELSATDFERHTAYVTSEDVLNLAILPQCFRGGSGCSYCELLAERDVAACAPATQFISFVFKYDFRTVVETLREWVESDASPADAATSCRFWFSPTTVNQYDAAEGVLKSEFWFETFATTIAKIGHTLPIMMPWRAPINLTRAWCVYEVYETAKQEVMSTFLLPAREREDMLRALVNKFDVLAVVVSGVALQDAEGGAEDRKQIMDMAAAHGMNAINGIVCEALREWLAGVGRAELERRAGEAVDAGTFEFMGQLGMLLKAQGKLEETEVLFRRALEGCETTLGALDARTLVSAWISRALLQAKGRLDEAEPLMMKRDLEGSEVTTLGAMHPSTLIAIGNLASLLQDQGKLDEAEPLSRRALEGCEATLGALHPSTLVAVSNLAALLQARNIYGELGEAYSLFRRALAGSEATLGPMHPSTLIVIGNLASLLQSQGSLEKAEPLYLRALEGSEATLGALHPSTLSVASLLAHLLQEQGKLDEAEPLLQRVLEGREVTLGPMHPSTLVAVDNLAGLLEAQGKLEEAEPLSRRAWEGQRVALGPSHPHTIIFSYNLVVLLKKLGRIDDARELCESELVMCRDTLGGAHRDTIEFINQLARLPTSAGGAAAAAWAAAATAAVPEVDPEWIASFADAGCDERTAAYYIQGALARGLGLDAAVGEYTCIRKLNGLSPSGLEGFLINPMRSGS